MTINHHVTFHVRHVCGIQCCGLAFCLGNLLLFFNCGLSLWMCVEFVTCITCMLHVQVTCMPHVHHMFVHVYHLQVTCSSHAYHVLSRTYKSHVYNIHHMHALCITYKSHVIHMYTYACLVYHMQVTCMPHVHHMHVISHM